MKKTGSNVKPHPLNIRSISAELPLLLALTIVPSLLFPLGSNPVEPPKAAWLWAASVVGVTLTWLIGGLGVWRAAVRRPWLRRLMTACLCSAAAVAVSVWLSDSPSLGWSGSALRRFGGGTELALLAVVILASVSATDPSARDRMLTAVALGSIAPTAYALLQWAGIDPLAESPQLWTRPVGTFGNPLFLGGYLVTVLPLTCASAVRADRPMLKRAWWALAVLQAAAFVAARSIGPALAIVAASALVGAMALAGSGRRRAAAMSAGVLALAAVAALAAGPRLVRAGTATIGVRASLWLSAGAGIQAERRLAFGSGLESITRVLTRYSDARLRITEGQDIAPDRAHNQTLDTVVALGLAGLAARLAIVYLGLAAAFAVFGLLPRDAHAAFAALATAVTLASGAAGWAIGGAWTLALSVPGAVALVTATWIGWRSRFDPAPVSDLALPVAAATASWLAHYLETQTGIASVSSALTAAVALAIAIGAAAGPLRALRVRQRGWAVESLAAAAAAAIALWVVAVTFAATDDRALTQQAQAFAAQADGTPDAGRRDALMRTAEERLARARAVNPYDYQHARNRGALERRWARSLPPQARGPHLEAAERWYALAIDLAPSAPLLWEEWANLALERRAPNDALPRLERTVALGLEPGELLVLTDAALSANGVDVAGPDGIAKAAEALARGGYPRLADLYARRSR